MGKSTLAAMVAQHPDVRRYFIDGVVWVYVGDKELNYARYTQCLRELVAQLDFYQGVPLFAELLHTPGEPLSKRRRREEGFMIYARDTIAELLHDRSVLIVLDDVCFEPDLDWFDFAPMPGEDTDDLESNCALLVTTRCRTLLPAADTVEIDMLDEADAISLLIQESGQLSHALLAESREARSVVRECANHPLAVKSVGRWLNLKHATAGVRSSVEEIHAEVIKSMDKILKGGSHSGNDDMLYEIMSMSLSPAINGDPTNIIKFCLAAFIVVFCDREYISDFALTEPTPIIPMDMAELLFETLLEMNESSLLQKGSLFYAQKKEAAVLIPEALSALGVLKVITYSDAEDDEEDPEDEQKFLQEMHYIHHEYGEFLAKEDPGLHDLTKDAERTWNRALVEAYLSHVEEWDIDLDDAAHSYALEMIVSHMIRGGMYSAAAELLADKSFVRGRLLSLGRENCTRRHIKDCETLFSKLRERRPRGSKLEPRSVMKQAYQALGSQLSVDDDEQSIEDSRIKDVEVARAHYEIGFSLAEKRCWDAAVAHWETSQELLESALGIVEVVAGILYNIGVVYSEINEYEQALDSLKQCLRIRGSIHGETHILYAQTIQRIGDIFLNMSDYHEAMESYNWALDVMYTEPTHHRVEIGEILDNKGTIHYSKGEIDEALQCHQEALRSKQYDLGEDHPELAATYHHIGNCLSDQGNVEDAIAHFEEAIRLKEIDPEGGPERDADVLTIEGILHNLEGNQEQGLECYEKSLQILVTKVPYRKEKVASLLHLIGCVYLMSGEQKKAMKLFEESLQARRKVLGFVHLDVASTLFNM
jgi:tetratricopeptide (TPR) repeat protein